MKPPVIACLVYLLIVFRYSRGKPIEVIYKGSDCPCAGAEYKAECEHGVSEGYGVGASGARSSSGDCSQPRIRISPQNTQVKYIFDYNVEIPIEPRKITVPLPDLFARVDKILIDTASAKIVNTDCRCSNAKAVKASLVAPCPVYSTQTCKHEYQALSYSKKKVPVDGNFNKLSKYNINIKGKRQKEIKKRDTTAFNKRYNQQTSFLNPSKECKFCGSPYSIEIFDLNLKLENCFICCVSDDTNNNPMTYELTSESKLANKKHTTTNFGRNLWSTSEPLIHEFLNGSYVIGHEGSSQIQSLTELVGSKQREKEHQQNATNNAFNDYIRTVVYSHSDFLEASGPQKDLLPSTESQRMDARDYIQMLIEDQLKGNMHSLLNANFS